MLNSCKELNPLKRKNLRIDCLLNDRDDTSFSVSFEVFSRSNVVLVTFPDGNYFGFPSVLAALDFLRINFEF